MGMEPRGPIRPLVAALVLLAAAPVAAEEAPAITLRFAWPDRLEGQRTERAQGGAGGASSRRTKLRVERRAEETWLHPSPVTDEEPLPEGIDPDLALVAGGDGRFVRLDGLDAWAAAEGALPPGSLASRAEAEAARKEALDRAERVAADAREQWSYQVETWRGRTLELGKAVETTGRVPVAAVPGLEVEQRVVLAARRWVSCTPGGLDRRCLELTLRSDAGPDAFRKGLAAAGGKAAKGFEDGRLSVELTLVADPETLLPWRYALTKRLRLVFAGRDLQVDQVERREREYQWWPAR